MGSEKKDVTGRRQFLVVPLTLKLLKRTMHIDNLSSATNRSLPGTHPPDLDTPRPLRAKCATPISL